MEKEVQGRTSMDLSLVLAAQVIMPLAHLVKASPEAQWGPWDLRQLTEPLRVSSIIQG